MSKQRRLEDKKRRRQKRLQKRHTQGKAFQDINGLIETLGLHAAAGMPATWPGACHPILARPDLVKAGYAHFALDREPGQGKGRRLITGIQQGLLDFLPEIDHWAMEEFLWHGLPGDSWHPLDAYIDHVQYPPPVADQLRRWKDARIGLFQVGEVIDDTMDLREWDMDAETAIGPWLRAIALNIGGVNVYRPMTGDITLTYLAPWAPAPQIFCAMGYGLTLPKESAEILLPYLGLRHAAAAAEPLPWNLGHRAEQQHRHIWWERDWQGWLAERLQFPFSAMVGFPPDCRPRVCTVVDLAAATPEHARDFGIYFAVPDGNRVKLAGATTVTPLDLASGNRRALAEYHAFRRLAGPPRRNILDRLK